MFMGMQRCGEGARNAAQGGTGRAQQARGPDQGHGEGVWCVMEKHSKERRRNWSVREMREDF